MKKSLLAVAVLGAFAGAASAQSSVTLFGVVDLSANQVKNGGTTLKTLDSNQLSSNRLGFRGVEDLGGGLQAGFWLEAGMDNSTGAVGGSAGAPGTVFFNRRSTVSLISKAGEIRLGRDYNPSFWQTVFFDVYGANGLGQMLNLTSTLGSGVSTFARSNNSITYHLPSGIGGLYGAVQVAAQEGNVTPTAAGNKYKGGRLGYAAGPVDVAVGYGVTKTTTVDDFKLTNVGASFDAGMVKVFGMWNKAQFGAKTLKTWELSASVPLGQGEFKAGYVKADAAGAGTDANDASQVSAQYIYNLSKRTALYTGASRISNKGKAAFAIGGSVSAADAAAGGFKSQGFNVGVRHSF